MIRSNWFLTLNYGRCCVFSREIWYLKRNFWSFYLDFYLPMLIIFYLSIYDPFLLLSLPVFLFPFFPLFFFQLGWSPLWTWEFLEEKTFFSGIPRNSSRERSNSKNSEKFLKNTFLAKENILLSMLLSASVWALTARYYLRLYSCFYDW